MMYENSTITFWYFWQSNNWISFASDFGGYHSNYSFKLCPIFNFQLALALLHVPLILFVGNIQNKVSSCAC
jgi:hypothetical protein